MDIKIVDYYLFSVPVNFDIATIHIPYSRHVIIKIQYQGRVGFGEGVLYGKSIHETEKFLQNYQPSDDILKFDSGLAEAFDEARLDAAGMVDHEYQPEYTKQVFIKQPEEMMEEIENLIKQGSKNIKIKLGRSVSNDIVLIKNLKEKFPKINFKADVNHGYDANSFIQVLNVNDGFINLWEEPLKFTHRRQIPGIKNKYHIKIMLDESVRSVNDLKQYIRRNMIDALNIKLSRIGGMTHAAEYIDLCRAQHIALSIGCNEELGVGMWSINTIAKKNNDATDVEGSGPERLDFDIVENGQFSEEKLKHAARNKCFLVFSKEKPMQLIDIVREIQENYAAKFINLLVICKII